MTTPEFSHDDSPSFDHVSLDDNTKEIIKLADIEKLLADLPPHLAEHATVIEKHRSYDFNTDELTDAVLPAIVTDMVGMGYDATGFVQFNVNKAERSSSVSLTFSLKREIVSPRGKPRQSMTEISTTIEPAHGEIPGKILTYINDGVETESDTDTLMTESDVYMFLASIAGGKDSRLVMMFLDHPEQFGEYLHNPFAFDDLNTMFTDLASQSYSQNIYRIDDPTMDPLDVTVSHHEEELTHVEAELWRNSKRTGFSLTASLNLVPPAPRIVESPVQADVPENLFDFGGGVETPAVRKEPTTLDFELGGNAYQPSLEELIDLESRLKDLASYVKPAVEIPFEEPDDTPLEDDEENQFGLN